MGALKLLPLEGTSRIWNKRKAAPSESLGTTSSQPGTLLWLGTQVRAGKTKEETMFSNNSRFQLLLLSGEAILERLEKEPLLLVPKHYSAARSPSGAQTPDMFVHEPPPTRAA